MRPYRIVPDMDFIVRRLDAGDRLVGPVTVPQPGSSRQPRPWGFTSGARADKRSVDGLAARGVVAVEEKDGRRRAWLVAEYQS